ncbi:hypothetical protein CLOSAC_18230 [Clostridium saccharobutylicum]|uniref:Uncharacterized protein n=1 Tax=Clostridium saccharobutylicum TaxID=169679 RepID=A0A1S8NB89_CLOSA|nr:hypothetical protein CLOSAC_18230 [Clostridium saccharobutylicum]
MNKTLNNRKVYLNYYESGEEKRIVFVLRDYDVLLKLILKKINNYC